MNNNTQDSNSNTGYNGGKWQVALDGKSIWDDESIVCNMADWTSEYKANAARIVECVNGWDSLVAERDQLKEKLEVMKKAGAEWFDMLQASQSVNKELLEALKLTIGQIESIKKASREYTKNAMCDMTIESIKAAISKAEKLTL